MTDYSYALADHTPDEIAHTAGLLRMVFPKARHLTAAYLHWQYVDNPDGRAVAVNAWAGAMLVGHMVGVPMVARLDGRDVRGIFLLNGAIHPQHRGRRLQSNISGGIFEEATRQGHAFSMGSGNKYSTGPLLTRHRLIRPLDAWLGLGHVPTSTVNPPSFERAWSDAALAWRLRNPGAHYTVRDGRVLAQTGVPGIAALLHEAVPLPDTGPQAPGPLRLFLGLQPGRSAIGAGFVPIPRRLRPSPLNLVWRDLGGAGLPDPERVLFRALDFDAY